MFPGRVRQHGGPRSNSCPAACGSGQTCAANWGLEIAINSLFSSPLGAQWKYWMCILPASFLGSSSVCSPVAPVLGAPGLIQGKPGCL